LRPRRLKLIKKVRRGPPRGPSHACRLEWCHAAGMAPDDPHTRDQDGVDSLRDTEAEAGDEQGIADDFDMDDREARELGVNLDDRDEPEPGFS
jgi:hypothetical protein